MLHPPRRLPKLLVAPVDKDPRSRSAPASRFQLFPVSCTRKTLLCLNYHHPRKIFWTPSFFFLPLLNHRSDLLPCDSSTVPAPPAPPQVEKVTLNFLPAADLVRDEPQACSPFTRVGCHPPHQSLCRSCVVFPSLNTCVEKFNCKINVPVFKCTC